MYILNIYAKHAGGTAQELELDERQVTGRSTSAAAYTEKLLHIQRSYCIYRETTAYSEKLLHIQRSYCIYRETTAYSEKLLHIARSYCI
jgi:hypothetical protein